MKIPVGTVLVPKNGVKKTHQGYNIQKLISVKVLTPTDTDKHQEAYIEILEGIMTYSGSTYKKGVAFYVRFTEFEVYEEDYSFF